MYLSVNVLCVCGVHSFHVSFFTLNPNLPFLLTKYLTHLFIHSYYQDYVSNLQQNFYSSIACNICCFAISTLLILMDLNQITPLPPFRYRILVLSCLHWPICISCRESFMNKICIPLWSPQASAKPQIRV